MDSGAHNADFMTELDDRGLIYQSTSDELGKLLGAGSLTAYIGFDPSAASLHVGSLLPALMLARFQRAGHKPIALVGGGTGMIGDPSGKDGERSMLSADQIEVHVTGLRAQLERFLDFDGAHAAVVVNNADWLCEVKLVEFLREIGKHFSVNQMMARDSVRPRIEDPERSISFTEFSYMLLQAYDYVVLHDRYGCTLQGGGSDQWGNIVSGCDLVRRMRGAEVHGFTIPLMLRADGRKFGKSESGNVWLDPELTSPYEFYQFWLNTSDDDVARCLSSFTFLPSKDLVDLAEAIQRSPEKREAQRVLAAQVTELVHGAGALARAEHTTGVLFGGGDWRELSAMALSEAFAQSPHSDLSRSVLGTEGAGLIAVVADSGLSPSRGQARKAIRSGAISINNQKVTDEQRVIGSNDLIDARYVVLRRGKKAYHVVDVGKEGASGR